MLDFLVERVCDQYIGTSLNYPSDDSATDVAAK
jgi:hypothetical protein